MPNNLQDAQTVARSTGNSPPVPGSQTPPIGSNYQPVTLGGFANIPRGANGLPTQSGLVAPGIFFDTLTNLFYEVKPPGQIWPAIPKPGPGEISLLYGPAPDPSTIQGPVQAPSGAAGVFFGANYNDSPGTPVSVLPNPILTQFRFKK